MRSVFFLFLTFVGVSSLLLFADFSGRFEVHATTAHALVALPTPLIVDAVPAASSSDAELATSSSDETESPPEIKTKSVAPSKAVPNGQGGLPVRLIIPSIGLDSKIVNVGVNSKGEMDVPGGDTDNVGWYQGGTVPGRSGSAVIAAHVFAAFERLDELRVGTEIYVETKNGTKLHFVVEEAKTYLLGNLAPSFLFSRNDARRLNLITCAGTFIQSKDTYDHRLVVYAKLS